MSSTEQKLYEDLAVEIKGLKEEITTLKTVLREAVKTIQVLHEEWRP